VAEHLTVAQRVAGSSPVSHPILSLERGLKPTRAHPVDEKRSVSESGRLWGRSEATGEEKPRQPPQCFLG
jgi:hypothetical protein